MAVHSVHVYEVRPRKDQRGVGLMSDVLPFGRLWYGNPNAISNAVGYAQHCSRSHEAVIHVYDDALATRSKRTSTKASSGSREVFNSRHFALPVMLPIL
jgi:hypothetical protein